jgi:HK97 family phage portal protein
MIESLASLTRNGANYDMLAANQQPVFERSGTLADARVGSALFNLMSMGASTYTGRPVSPQTAMTYGAVYACVAKIAKAIASCPLVTYRHTGKNEDTKTPARDDYRYRLLKEQPNPEMSSFQWRESMVAHLLLWGNHYSYLDWDGAGRLRSVWPLEPGYVQVMRTQIGGELVYRYFPHNPYSVPVKAGIYSAQSILHIPYLGFDGLMGYSPIALARQGISLGLGAEEYAARFFQNGGKPPYWIEHPGDIKDSAKFMETWRTVYAGLENSGKAAILWGGMKAHEFSMSPEDAQFLEGRNFQVSEVGRIFDMHPYFLGDPGGKASTFAAAEQANIYFATHTVSPVAGRIEAKVNMTILGANDALTSSHDLRKLYRGDMKTIAEAHSREIACGKINPNEARAESDMNPGGPDLDKHYMNGGMATVEYISKNGSGGSKANATGIEDGSTAKE